MTGNPPRTYPNWVPIALWMGIAAQLLFVLIAVIGGAMHPGYSHVEQAISELTAAGAANKGYLDIALLVMEVMGFTFGIGYFAAVRQMNRRLKVSAALIAAVGVIGLWFYAFPMDPVGSPITCSGQMHLLIVSVSALAAIAAVFLAASGWAHYPKTRVMSRMSWTMLALMLVSGLVSVPVTIWGWPGIGVWQRLNNGAFGFWQIATAGFLLMQIRRASRQRNS